LRKAKSVSTSPVLAALVVATIFGGPTTASAAQADGFRLAKAVPLRDGGSGWDHVSVDEDHRHVFIGRGTYGLAVVDADTGALLQIVAETAGSHGAAIAADLGLGFSDNGRGGDLTIFDLVSLRPIGHLQVGDTTDGVFYDPATRTGMVNNGETGRATFFDPVSNRVLGSVDLGSKKPEFAVADGRGNIFIDLQDRNSIARIDMRTRSVAETWALPGCEQPSSITSDPSRLRLFVGCRGSSPVMSVVDATSGRTITSLPIGHGNDWAGYDARDQLILFANGQSATLTVIRQDGADQYREDETVGTRPLARTGGFDAKTGTVFLVTAQYSRPGPGADGKPGPVRIWPDTAEVLMLREAGKEP
jgi:DNA-binding beta-propeller fold protein YncE